MNKGVLIVDEYDQFMNAGLSVQEIAARERESTYLQTIGLFDWNLCVRFDDRFDVRVGGWHLEFTQSIVTMKDGSRVIEGFPQPRTLEEMSEQYKQYGKPNEAMIVDWHADGIQVPLDEAAKRGEEFASVVAFTRNRVTEWEAWRARNHV